MAKVWLISATGTELGRHIAEEALSAGERVVAIANGPDGLAGLQARYPDRCRVLGLDGTLPSQAERAAQAALETYGRVDVLLAHGGHGQLAPFEQTDDAAFREQLDANLYPVVNLARAVLPIMRQQRSGHVLTVASVGARLGLPGMVPYQASQWALGGFSESLAREVGPLGIRVCCIEPGDLHTAVRVRADDEHAWLPEYAATVGTNGRQLGLAAQECGDPRRVAQVILRLAYHDSPPAHLLLGSDALQHAGRADVERTEAELRWRAVTLGIDRNASVPLPMLPRR